MQFTSVFGAVVLLLATSASASPTYGSGGVLKGVSLHPEVSLLHTKSWSATDFHQTCTPTGGDGHGNCQVRELHNTPPPATWKNKNIPCGPTHAVRPKQQF